MARVEYGPVVTRIRGAVGGLVFQRIGTTDSVRLNGYNRRNSWDSSLETTNQFRVVANTWKTLTPSERVTWYDNAPSWPAFDKWGEPRNLSGYQLFLFVNRNLLVIGIDLTRTLPPYYTPEWACDYILDFNVTSNQSFLSMNSTRGYAEQVLVYASSLFGASYNAKYPKTTFVVFNPQSGSSNPNLYAYLVAFWGREPLPTERFYLQTRIVITDGTYKGCTKYSAQRFVNIVT